MIVPDRAVLSHTSQVRPDIRSMILMLMLRCTPYQNKKKEIIQVDVVSAISA